MFKRLVALVSQNAVVHNCVCWETNMLFFKLLIWLLICLERTGISAERNHFCQAMVIEECSNHSKGLLRALESRNRRLLIEECHSLQAS